MFNPSSRCYVQSTIKMTSPNRHHVAKAQQKSRDRRYLKDSNDRRDKLDKRLQNQLHRLNRRCTIGTFDGCRIDRRPSIGACLGAIWNQVKTVLRHRFNQRVRNRHGCNQRTIVQRRCQVRSSKAFSTGRTDAPSEQASVQWRQQEKKSATATWRSSVTGRTDASLKLLRPCQRSQRLLQSAMWPEEPMP